MKQVEKENQEESKGSYIALGMCLGVTFGMLFNNLALGISIGTALGVILDSKQKNNKE